MEPKVKGVFYGHSEDATDAVLTPEMILLQKQKLTETLGSQRAKLRVCCLPFASSSSYGHSVQELRWCCTVHDVVVGALGCSTVSTSSIVTVCMDFAE